MAESFFATIKAELIELGRYATRAIAVVSIGDYIDQFYTPSDGIRFLATSVRSNSN